MFSEPASGDRLNPRDIVGELLIVRPTEHRTGLITQFSKPGETSDAICVNVVDLDQKDDTGSPGYIYHNVLWFQGQLIGALRSRIGEVLLGRIGRGMGMPGRQAPFIFESATQDQTAVARAQAWLAQHSEFLTITAPVQPKAEQSQPTTQASPQQQQTVLDQLRRAGQHGYGSDRDQQSPGY